MSANAMAFGDPLGPKGRRRVAVATAAAGIVVAAVLVVAVRRFQAKGQLKAELWTSLYRGDAPSFFLKGLENTLKAAVAAGVLALAASGVLAFGRLSTRRLVRLVATAWLEFFRGVPLVLLILFCFFGLPKLGFDPGRYWSLVLGLVLYNSAILAEIVRAGILSLDHGQSEAALAVGLSHGQAMRLVVLPQALRRMVPSLVSQVVVLLKDTSLGVAISYEELLRRGQLAGALLKNPLQALVLVAAIYVAVNLSLSLLSRRLERTQRRGGARKVAPTTVPSVAGVEDLSTPIV